MKKNTKFLLVSLSAVLAVGAVIGLTNHKGGLALFADEGTVTYKHYQSIAPTPTAAGIKEYWVSCNDNEHVFSAPTGNHVIIEEGVWTEEKAASVLALDDDRKIEAGDLEGYMYQSTSFINGNIISGAEISNLALDGKDITFRAGFDRGTTEGGEYIPPKNAETGKFNDDNQASFNFTNSFLKVLDSFGYDSLVFTVQANSVLSEYDFYANRFATITNGGGDWKTNYMEDDHDLETPSTFAVDISNYQHFTEASGYANSYFSFLIRNSAYPTINSVVSDVRLTNIGFSSHGVAKAVNVEKTSRAIYSLNDEGFIDNMSLEFAGREGGFNVKTGIYSKEYFQAIYDAGYPEIELSFTWTDNEHQHWYHKFIDGNDSPLEGFDRISTKSLYTDDLSGMYYGFTKAGGTIQVEGRVDISFKFLNIRRSDFIARQFNNDNLSSLYGFDCTLHGTFDKSISGTGSGGTGTAVLSNGAAVDVYREDQKMSKNAMFYAWALHAREYSPELGDLVVFKAGTYSEPENQWGILRSLVLDEDLMFFYTGEYFVEVKTANDAKGALDTLWGEGQSHNIKGLSSTAKLMSIAGYTKVSAHYEIASLYEGACTDLSNFRLVPCIVTDNGTCYDYQRNDITETGADFEMDLGAKITKLNATFVDHINFIVRCWHDDVTDLEGHVPEDTGCWKDIGNNVLVSNVTFAE